MMPRSSIASTFMLSHLPQNDVFLSMPPLIGTGFDAIRMSLVLRISTRSRPQRKRLAALNTGSNLVEVYFVATLCRGSLKAGSYSSSVSYGLGFDSDGQRAPGRK